MDVTVQHKVNFVLDKEVGEDPHPTVGCMDLAALELGVMVADYSPLLGVCTFKVLHQPVDELGRCPIDVWI